MRHLVERGDRKILREMVDLFGLDDVPQRIEIYDNSHMVRNQYDRGYGCGFARRIWKEGLPDFNIRDAGASDDYAMMREVTLTAIWQNRHWFHWY